MNEATNNEARWSVKFSPGHRVQDAQGHKGTVLRYGTCGSFLINFDEAQRYPYRDWAELSLIDAAIST